MEKLPDLNFNEAMDLLKEDIMFDRMPWYKCIPLNIQIVKGASLFQDNMDKMLTYLTTKYAIQEQNKRIKSRG